MTLKALFLQISIWSVILPLITGVLILKKLNKDSKIVLGMVVVATMPQILTAFIMDSKALIILYNVYTPVEFLLVLFLFYDRIRITHGRIFWGSVWVFLLGSIGLVVSFGLFTRFLNEWVCLSNVIYMLWILLFIRNQYGLKTTEINKHNPFAWFVVGISLYAPCTLLVFAFYHYIKMHPSSLLNNLWVIHSFFNIALYIFFTMGFISNLYKPKESLHSVVENT